MAPQLPPPNNVVALPDAPQDPATAHDVVAAYEYRTRVDKAWSEGKLTDKTHLADALVYEHSVVASYDGAAVAPAWFSVALQDGLKFFEGDIANVKPDKTHLADALVYEHRVVASYAGRNGLAPAWFAGALEDGLKSIKKDIANVKQLAARGLPPLTSQAAVKALSLTPAKKYLEGYELAVPHILAERHEAILRFIGCTWQYSTRLL
ncbi:hypothetical protein FB45DRAFT_1023664 [Roridomyces roridus]|uniref:Mug135-like C-terminal domain-containing protein n=1 Tax=Roridomyces roridus TaxID=1738132 RepID=A0AAD7C4T7_9AGAR|nr:hypothetical protein FB45DRAFT_1023664 [Roridomyces roridus]